MAQRVVAAKAQLNPIGALSATNISLPEAAACAHHSAVGAAYRGSIYTNQFPTGSWLEVRGLALPDFMIEIELEAHSPQ